MTCKTPCSRRGYVLAVTIWIVVALFLGVSTMIAMSKNHVKATALLEKKLNAQLRAESIFELLTYALKEGTYQYDFVQIEPIRTMYGTLPGQLALDGSVRPLWDGTTVSLQDLGGRLNVKYPNAKALIRLVSNRSSINTAVMEDAAKDWIDADQFKSLNGAEAAEYRKAGSRIRPRNAYAPQALEELRFIKGFDRIKMQQWNSVTGSLFYGILSNMNVFTMDENVLKHVLNVSMPQVRSLMRTKKRSPERFVHKINALQAFDIDYMRFRPTQEMRMRIVSRYEEAVAKIEAQLYFEPFGDEEVTIVSYSVNWH